MQIREIDGFVAHCEAKGVRRDVNLFLLQEANLQPGDYVLVHVGYALQKISEAHARSAWELFDKILQAEVERDHA
jgi:hydrogenase expression/formation protein HypC